jgi:hypothetical protein
LAIDFNTENLDMSTYQKYRTEGDTLIGKTAAPTELPLYATPDARPRLFAK